MLLPKVWVRLWGKQPLLFGKPRNGAVEVGLVEAVEVGLVAVVVVDLVEAEEGDLAVAGEDSEAVELEWDEADPQVRMVLDKLITHKFVISSKPPAPALS